MAEELEIVCLIQPNWCYNWYYLSSKKSKKQLQKKKKLNYNYYIRLVTD